MHINVFYETGKSQSKNLTQKYDLQLNIHLSSRLVLVQLIPYHQQIYPSLEFIKVVKSLPKQFIYCNSTIIIRVFWVTFILNIGRM